MNGVVESVGSAAASQQAVQPSPVAQEAPQEERLPEPAPREQGAGNMLDIYV
jgi:hypothetical protein